MDSSRIANLDRALRLILSGELEAGLAAYEQCLDGDEAFSMDVGTHLVFLERAGHAEAVSSLRRLALARGVDVSVSRQTSAPPVDAAREYGELIKSGAINSVMVDHYLAALAKFGRSDEVNRLLDYPRLLRVTALDSGTDLASGVKEAILRNEHLAEHQQEVQSVRNMINLRRFHAIADDAARQLMAELQAQVDDYLAQWAGSDHPLALMVPTRSRLSAWALISRGDGFNVPHVHHKGWATGVYYPSDLPSNVQGGELSIGRPTGEGEPFSDDIVIRPRAGLLVLFPSYYTHRTTPISGRGERMSVAFDVIRESSENLDN